MFAGLFFLVFFVFLYKTVSKNEAQAVPASERFVYNKSGRIYDRITEDTCVNFTYDLNHNGHDVIVGDNSGRVLMDYTVQKAKSENKTLAEKSYQWVEYKNLTSGRAKDYRSIWLPVDQVVGKPYRLTPVPSFQQTANRAYKMEYLQIPDRDTIYGLLWADETKYLSKEEAEKYIYYGPGFRNF